jgi:hypothetical protein
VRYFCGEKTQICNRYSAAIYYRVLCAGIEQIPTGREMAEGYSPQDADCGILEVAEGKRRRTRIIVKLTGARCELEDVVRASSESTVLSKQERDTLSDVMGAIDNIVRNIQQG